MSRTSHPLTPELLDRFAQASQRAGGPLRDVIGPGLSDHEIDGLLEPLGLRPSDELRVFWRWGTMPERPTNGSDWQIHPHFELLPPSLAVAETLERRADPLIPHKATWLAFAVDQAPCYLMVDCETAAVSPVVYSSEGDGHDRAAACSIGSLVEYWTQQIDNGDSYHDGLRWRQAKNAQPATPLSRR